MSTRSTTLGIRLVALLAVLGRFCAADDAFDKLFSDGKFNEAVKYADEKIPVGERDASIWAKLGVAHEGQKMTEKALACYMVAIRNDAKNYEAHLGAARINNNLNQYENGLEMAKKALAIKTTGEASWEYARASLALKSPETKTALEKVVETDKSNAMANRELGNIYYEEKKYDKALPLLKTAYNSQTDGETAFKLATAYQKQKNLDSAAHYFKEATRDKSFKNTSAGLELSRIYYKQEKLSLAAQEYGKLEMSKLSADDLYKFGHSLSKDGASKDSITSVLVTAVQKFGSSVSREALLAREKVGRAKLEKKAFQDALNLFLVINKADPQEKIIKEQSFLMAEAYDGLGQRQKAIPMLEKIIATDKNNVEAYARLADLYSKEKMGDKAQQVYQKLLSLQPNNPKVYMSLGEYSLKTRKFEDALKYFQKSFTLEQNADAAQGMMNAAWELKKYDLAADAAESALHKDSTLREPQLILAKIHLQNKNYTAAQQILEKLSKTDKTDKEIWMQLATCYEQTKNSSKLAEVDKTIMELDKKNVVSRQRFAASALSSNNHKEALETYKELASLTPRDAAVFQNLYTISLKLNNKNDATDYLRRFLKLMPKDAAAHKDLGNILIEKKDSTAALASYRTALGLDPAIKGFYKTYVGLVMAQTPPKEPLPKGKKTLDEEIFEALTAAVNAGEADEKICTDLAQIHLKRKNYAAASELYQKALQINPKNTAILSELAACQAKAGQTDAAIISYEQVTSLNQSSVGELKLLGGLYNKSGKKDQAIAAYKKYLEKASEPTIAFQVAEYEFEKKNHSEAVKYYQKVTGKKAKDPICLLHYGTAAYQNNDLKKASELFKDLTVVNPKDPEPFKTLYEIALKEKKQELAAENLQKYCSLKPGDTPMLLVLANLYYDLKNTDSALQTYKAVFKADPKAKGLYKRYLELLSKKGTAEEKILALNGAVNAGEADVNTYIQLGDLYKDAGNHAKAIPCYEKASQLDAKNTSVLSALAECQVKAGTVSAAILTYEQSVAMNPGSSREYRILGDLYKKDNKTESAIKNYKKYLEKNSDNGLAKEVGEYAFAQKNYADAIKYIGMVSGPESEKMEFLKMYADAHYLNKDEAKAYDIYRKLGGKPNADADIFKKLYEIAGKLGTKENVLTYLQKYAALKPSDVEAQRTLGDNLYEKKDSSGALAAYKAVLKADPKAKGFYQKYTGLLIGSGAKDEEVAAALQAGISAGEANVKMYRGLADIYSKQNNHLKAVQMYEKASQLDTKNVGLISSLAEAQAKSGNTSAAIMTYEQAVAMNPQANSEFKILGDLYKKDKKTESAIKNYKKYLEKNSENDLAKQVGEFAYSKKNYPEVIKYLSMVSGSAAEKPALLKMLADAYFQTKDDQKAYEILKKLNEKLPSDADVVKNLYEIAERTGKSDEYISYLKKYVGLKPTDVEALRTLGDKLYEEKDSSGALVAYRQVLKIDPKAKGFYKKYAELLMKLSSSETELVSVLSAGIAAGEADINMYQRLASIYSKQGNHAKAVQMYEKASQLDTKNVELISLLGESQAKSGNNSAAIMTYEQAIAMNPKANKEYKVLGDLYKKDKKTEAAIKNYKKYLENNSDNDLAREIGEFAYSRKNYGEVIKYLSMVSGSAAANPSLLEMFADAYRQVKNDAKAYEIYKKMAEKTPNNAEVFKNLYEIAEKTGNNDEFLIYLKKYAALKPADVAAQRTLGDKLFEKKNNAGAIEAYKAVLKADPKATGFYKKYAELIMNSSSNDQEIAAVLNAGIAIGEADFKMYERLASIYAKQGNHAKAVEMYEKASQLDPKNIQILILLAESQSKSGKIKEAIMTYEQAVAMNPKASKEYKTLGDLYKKDNKSESAISNYKKYLDKNADSDLAKEVGEYAFEAKKYDEAIKYLSMVSGKDANDPALLKKFGEACYQVKDYQKANKVFKQLSQSAPSDADVMLSLYDIAGKLGSKDEALSYLKKYTALKPADVEKQSELGDALFERKDEAGAMAAYRAVLTANPSAKGFFKKYAGLVMKNGKDPEIVSVLNAAIAAGEADAEMYLRLGSIYYKQGNFSKAVSMYDKASQLNPKDGSLLIKLAQSQAKSGALSAAILTYEQAIAMNPQANEEHKALGDLYMQQKKTDSAIKAYKKYLEKSQDNNIARLVGENALKSNNHKEAVKYLAMVTGADASDKGHLMKFAMACYQAKDEFRAYQLFKQLSNITPNDPVVFEKLYEIAGRAGTKDEVLSYLRKFAELKPTDAKAQITLGDMLLEKKDEAGALAAYRAALKADSSAKGFYKKYAELVIKSGTDAEKVVAINGAIKQGGADARMYKVLADIYSKQNQLDKAIAMYDKAAQLDTKNPQLLTSLAECQIKKGAVNDAILTLEQAVAINPTANQEYKSLGELYLKQNKTESALKYYKKYLEKNPSDDKVALIVGQQAFKDKSYQDAVKFLGMVKGADRKKASFLSMYGEAAFEVKDFPRALIIYKDLALITPKVAAIFKRLYEICTKTGASEDALAYLKKYSALKPADADAQKDLGDALYGKKEFPGALAAYKNALRYNPKIKGFHKKYVELVLKLGKPQEKMPALQGAINAGEADASIYSQLGQIYSDAKNYIKAIEMYEKASQLDPKNAEILSSLADCQMKKGDLTGAALTYEQALAMNPKAVDEYKQLGDLYMKQKKTDAAMTAYKKYLDKAPTDYSVAKLVGRNYYAAKDYVNAYKYFNMVKDDISPQFLIELGLSALHTKNTRVAIATLEKVRGLKGSFASKDLAYKSLAEAYEASGEKIKAAEVLNEYVKIPGVKDPDASYKRAVVYEGINATEAVKMYNENLVAFPKDHRNYMKLGVYYSRQKGGEQSAAKYLEKVPALTDSMPKVWLELGSLYLRMKKDQNMINAYRKYLEVAPEDADAIGKIGEILLSRKMVDDAMVFLEIANSQKENDPKIMTLLARGYIMTKRRKEGADLLEKVVKITRGKVDDDLRMVLVDVYMETNQFEKAADELKVLISVKRDKDVMIKYARVLFELGKPNDALSLVQEVKSKDPENLEALMMIGKVKTGQKKYDDAIETYKEILYIDQNYAPALCERANVYLLQGKYQWAQTFYDRALKADPKNAMVHLGLARLSKRQKDYAGYSEHLEKARKLDPQNREIQEEIRSVKR